MDRPDTDIWGYAWSPCPACPYPEPDACPSRRHRRYCRLVETSPSDIVPILLEQPPEYRIAAATPPPIPERPRVEAPVVERPDPDPPRVDDASAPTERTPLDDIASRILSCPYRGPEVGACRCRRVCLARAAPGNVVTRDDCWDCQESGGPQAVES